MKYFFPVVLALLVLSCKHESESSLQAKVDSLQQELKLNQEMAKTLGEVGTLMDSIDATRQALRINMVEGSTYDVYVDRMQGLNNYVRETQRKIEKLEKSLRKSRATANAYAKTIAGLKAELETKNKEIAQLRETVEKYKNENQNLMQIAEMQELELAEQMEMVEIKRQELEAVEKRIEEVIRKSQVSDAEGYYARAAAVEETARRTKLAPRKRRETLQEALELYRKSQSLGHAEAAAAIKRLEAELR